MDRLAGKTAIVTGGGRGIGRAIALLLAQEGARIAVIDVQETLARETTHLLQRAGGMALALQADVSVGTEVDRTVAEVVQVYDRIDILVNNAGIGGSKTCLETEDADWDRMLAVNLKSVFLFCRRVIAEMVKFGQGKIVNIASMYGMLGSPHTAAYSASKAGVINFTRQLAVDYAAHHIYVNAISPGLIETEMTRHKLEDESTRSHFVQPIPLGRAGKPEDIALAVLFLASENSNFITGHNLVVDGGQSCRII
jgi:NAD(P)-dependent dehydrogenase (short-subunit alcohol dehydrogenase family)